MVLPPVSLVHLFSWEKSRDFEIGDIVYYLEGFNNENENERQGHLKWMIKFKAADGKIYTAIQTYFITMDNWKEIENYLKITMSTKPRVPTLNNISLFFTDSVQVL
ncbi:MAG: hypothetical protein ACYCX4_18335 [Bacillota bacterium]